MSEAAVSRASARLSLSPEIKTLFVAANAAAFPLLSRVFRGPPAKLSAPIVDGWKVFARYAVPLDRSLSGTN